MNKHIRKILTYVSDRFLELFYNSIAEQEQVVVPTRAPRKKRQTKNQIKIFIDGNHDVLSKIGTYTVVPPPSEYNYISVKMYIEDELVVEVDNIEGKDYSSKDANSPIKILNKKIVPFFALNFSKKHEPKTIQFMLGIADTETFWKVEVKYVEQTFA